MIKIIREYVLIVAAIVIFIFISAALYFVLPSINSNIYVAISTFIVGCFALMLYIKQKRDQKRDAASVILAEIRYAEHIIDKLKTSGVSTGIQYQIIPSNNWNKYNYLFINDLDQDEINEINNFYNQCFILDRALDQVNISHELKNKSKAIHNALSDIAKESLGDKNIFEQNKANFIKLIEPDKYRFIAEATLEAITNTLNNVRFITTSTAGAKLKDIINNKLS